MVTEEKQFLTVKEVAQFLNIHEQSVYKAIRIGKLKEHRIPEGGIRIHIDELKRFINAAKRSKRPTLIKRKRRN